MIQGQDFVWFLPPPWDGLWTRQQHFATILSEQGNRVLYVERPISALGKVLGRGENTAPWRPRLRQVNKNLWVLTPPPLFPGAAYSCAANYLNNWLVTRVAESFVQRLQLSHPIVWVRIPKLAPLSGALNPKLLIYDCTDRYEAFDGQNRALMLKSEAMITSRADLIFVTSEQLLPRFSHHPRCYWVSNGVDWERFSGNEVAFFEDPVQRPIAGYVGRIAYWLDEKLLTTFLERWPGSVVFVGPSDEPGLLERLKRYPSFTYLGPIMDRQQLGSIARAFDVALIPFQVNDLTESANVLKAREYLAAGRPVVSTPLAGIQSLQHFIRFASDPNSFVQEALDAVLADTREAQTARRDAMRAFSWEALAEQVSGHIADALAAKPHSRLY